MLEALAPEAMAPDFFAAEIFRVVRWFNFVFFLFLGHCFNIIEYAAGCCLFCLVILVVNL